MFHVLTTITFHNLPHPDAGQQLAGLCALYIICLGTRRVHYVAPLSQLLLLMLTERRREERI